MMDWKLWYWDRSTFSSEDGTWFAAPARGVAGLVYPSHRAGRQIDMKDHYFWPAWSDQPYGGDIWGALDHLLEEGVLAPHESLMALSFEEIQGAGVKFGRTLPSAEWEQVYRLMVEDPDFPQKSAHERRERVP